MRRSLLLASLLFSVTVLLAQKQGAVYQSMTNVSVTAYGKEQSMPFSGGLNNPQFTMGDLNNDGKQDLVVFETALGVKTFLNVGMVNGAPKYAYAPQYERNFPACNGYMTFADYNKDGIADLFTQIGASGYVIYTGYYNPQKELCFKYYTYLVYLNDTTTPGWPYPKNAYVNSTTDIPAIVDVDNDGELDFLSFDVSGKFISEYKNERKILNDPPDSVIIYLKDACWGKFYQGFYREHVLGYDCTEPKLYFPKNDTFYNKVTHVGNTMCLFDYDGDGDLDYLDGSIQWNEMTLCINGRIEKGVKGPDSMIAQDTLFPSNNRSVELPLQPAAFNIDVDQDGQKDLLIAPHSAGVSENYKCVWFYKNGTTPGHPSWTFKTDTMFIDQMIDVGTGAYPAFFDYDKDGKPDLFVGTDGYYQTSGLLLGKIAYYHNTSTPGNPSFELVTKDFMGLSSAAMQGMVPTFGDINNDGKTDMVVAHTDGTLSVYLNSNANTVQPNWVLSGTLKDSAGNIIGKNGDHSAPFMYDLNKDGKSDLVLGGNTGYLQYYENHGTAGNISLVLKASKLGQVKVDAFFSTGAYSTPFIGRMDNTGVDYLLVGSNSGSLYKYTGFQSGTLPATFTRTDSQYSFIDSTWSRYWHGYGSYTGNRSAPAVADIDGDGKYEMVVGEVAGGLKIYEQSLLLGTEILTNAHYKVNAYPNPAKDLLTLDWGAGFAQQDIVVSIYNAIGEQVAERVVSGALTSTQISLPNVPNGIYFCKVVSGNNKGTVQVAILK